MEQDQHLYPEKRSVANNAMTYGAIIGISLVVVSLLFYILNVENTTVVFWIQFILLIAGIIFSILSYRKTIGQGFINYGKSLGTGVLTGLFASIIVGFYIYVFFQFIDTGAINEILLKTEDAVLKQTPDISDADLEKIMSMQKKFMTPLWMAIMSMLSFIFYSFIASLIISIFTRKTDKSFEANFR